ELANLIDDAIGWVGEEDIALAEHIADAILAAGYVKADREEFAVRRGGVTYPQVFFNADGAREWADGFVPRSVESEVIRRLVGPWEVA
ncbi:hypothetical protein, partial [Prescottella equi]|uniref:hypothetical protein n=1 Tax=Rhodococcus hoagii TaxID=43767 RepID=UPI001585D08E